MTIMSSLELLNIATEIAISAIKPKENEIDNKLKKNKQPWKNQQKENRSENNEQEKNEKAVSTTTINDLLAFLQSKRNLNELLLYIMRQTGRGEIDKETGKLLLKNLKDKNNIEDALTLLGYVKWIYETLDKLKVNYDSVKDIKEFLKLVEFLSKEETKK